MSLPGQPPPSPALQKALGLLALGRHGEAEQVVRDAALNAKAQFGSGSHELARGYGDLARVHHRLGDVKRAAAEFKHACECPLPPDTAGRHDRLALMFGFAACLERLGKLAEAEKVYRQCVAFARNLTGPASPGYAASLEPLASLLLAAGQPAEAAQLMDECYAALWNLGDRQITAVIPTRAEALKAVGRPDNAFADIADLPDDLIAETAANVIGRSGRGDGVRVRLVLADLLKFLDKKYGDGHPTTADTVAAVAHHEARLGPAGDPKVRARATRRAVWSFATRRVPDGLLDNLEVGFEEGGTVHLVPVLLRDPSPDEAAILEAVLTQAVDDLYARSKQPAG